MPAVLDTGVVVALANRRDPHHAAAVDVLRTERAAIHIPQGVIAEAAFVIRTRASRKAEIELVRGVASSDWRLESLGAEDLSRTADLLETYADSGMDFVDASVIAIAERIGAGRIYTLDRRDFQIVRPRHVAAFELLP